MTDWTNWIGLARRAGAMAPGHSQVEQALLGGTAKLIVIAEDAGPSVDRKYHLWAQDLGVPLVRAGTKETLGRAMGLGPHAVLAILDKNISQRMLASGEFPGGSQHGRKGQGKGLRAGKGTQTRQSPTHRSASSAQSGKHQESHEHGGAGSGTNGKKHYGGKVAPGTQSGGRGKTNRSAGHFSGSAAARGGEKGQSPGDRGARQSSEPLSQADAAPVQSQSRQQVGSISGKSACARSPKSTTELGSRRTYGTQRTTPVSGRSEQSAGTRTISQQQPQRRGGKQAPQPHNRKSPSAADVSQPSQRGIGRVAARSSAVSRKPDPRHK